MTNPFESTIYKGFVPAETESSLVTGLPVAYGVHGQVRCKR
jgi:hypothetical protein